MPLRTPIEMVFTLQGETSNGAAGMVICRGRVVRIEPGSEADPRSAMAATIANYRLLHPHERDPKRI